MIKQLKEEDISRATKEAIQEIDYRKINLDADIAAFTSVHWISNRDGNWVVAVQVRKGRERKITIPMDSASSFDAVKTFISRTIEENLHEWNKNL